MHNVEVIGDPVELSDELVAFRCRCCGEPLTDSWLTVSVHHDDIEGALQKHKDKLAARHEKKHAFRTKYLKKDKA